MVSLWHHIGIDLIGPLPLSKQGNQFILTITDYFTKYVDAIPLPNKCATGVATALIKVNIHNYISYIPGLSIVCIVTCPHGHDPKLASYIFSYICVAIIISY